MRLGQEGGRRRSVRLNRLRERENRGVVGRSLGAG